MRFGCNFKQILQTNALFINQPYKLHQASFDKYNSKTSVKDLVVID